MAASRSTTNPNSLIFQTFTSSKVCMHVSSDVARIGVYSMDKPGLVPSMCNVLEKHKIELVSLKVSPHGSWKTFILTIRSNGPRPDEMLDGVTVEDIYKRAAEEIASSV